MTTIRDALTQIERFRGKALKITIANLERRLTGARYQEIVAINTHHNVNNLLIASAAEVKRASAQIDVIIHAIGILISLPYILEKDEFLESTSLGAGNAGSDFDIVTNQRIGEFKFINWRGGSEAVRKKTFFEDYYKLIRDQSTKTKYFYLLNTEIPLRFLNGNSKTLRILSRNRRLADEYQKIYGNQCQTVGDFYRLHKDRVNFVNLVDFVPGIEHLIGLPIDENDVP